jgi:undecaprenyl-diphosphatase
MALSRVFCGVHYPFDIFGGMIIGLIIGWIVIEIWKAVNKKLKIL